MRSRVPASAPPPGPGGPLLGAHMSVAAGVSTAFARGVEAGCATMQVFTRNATRWAAPRIPPGEIRLFRSEQERTRIAPVLAHGSYLANLASPDRALLARSRRALLDELARAASLGLPFVVVHPGAHMGAGVVAGLARVARSVDWLLDRSDPAGPAICLENTAGQGTVLGGEFGHLRDILAAAGSPARVGVCLDSCHAHAAGYGLGDAEGYAATLAELEAAVGVGRVLAVHLNDARGERGSRVDRHEHIGRGRLGLECFRLFMNDPRFARVPKIIETPKTDGGREMDPVNLGLLRRLAGAPSVPPGLARAARKGAGRSGGT